MSSVFTTEMLNMSWDRKNPLFRLVVGNVENGDLVGGGDSVVQVHA